MSYEQSRLWKLAFEEERDDVTKKEQEYFRNQYNSMRGKVIPLVERISHDMPHMTVHDISHIDALWEMGSIMIKNSFQLNPPEAFVFGASALIHDAAMTVEAYPGGKKEVKNTTVWKDSFSRLKLERKEGLRKDDDDSLEKLATNEALRQLHALQAENLATRVWRSENAEDEYLISDPELRSFYGPTIGKIAHSHWWTVSKISDEFVHNLGPLPGKTKFSIDLILIASLLRLSDAMHIDARRAPSFLRMLVGPTGISDLHWKFQGKMAVPIVKDRALQYSAASPFGRDEAEAWWLAFDAISIIDRELRDVDHLFQQSNRTKFSANRVFGANSPRDLAQYIKTEKWDPVDCQVRVSDVPKIVGALGGEKLYGNDTNCAIRELIQNAADAVIMRRSIENRSEDWGHIAVALEHRDQDDWLVVQDTGVGMSANVLTGPLVDFGNSFWRMPLAAQEFPGIHSSGISTVGRYGIGFFSVFMLGEKVLVNSRRYDKSTDSSRTLEFQNGLASRPILYKTPEDSVPLDGGTCVEVCLSHLARCDDGILGSHQFGFETQNLRSLVGFLAPSLSVELRVKEYDDEEMTVVEANDWMNLQEKDFLLRLSNGTGEGKEEKPGELTRLRPLQDQRGNLLGRASIQPRMWSSKNPGCVSVGGLRANSLRWINGLFQGKEKTASRDSAVVHLPPGVLRDWATEQAKLLEEASFTDEVKAYGAAVILLCGGSIGELPFARLEGEWLSVERLKSVIQELDEVRLYFENEVQYDEDEDEVHPKKFSNYFEEASDVIFLPDDFPDRGVQISVSEVLVENSDKISAARLSSVFFEILNSVWKNIEQEQESTTVGHVETSTIVRIVTRFSKVN